MGEYALLNGQEIKIGTCEDMLYLRADQAHLVRALRGNVNPRTEAEQIRFRFPFPHEDSVQPGAFSDPFFALGLYGVEPPKDIDHDNIQFRNERGLLVSLPCPEGNAPSKHVIAYNGYPGKVRISQQRLVDGKLVLICECGSCGAKYRVPTLEDAAPILKALREKTDRPEFYGEIARRIEAGYTEPNHGDAQSDCCSP